MDLTLLSLSIKVFKFEFEFSTTDHCSSLLAGMNSEQVARLQKIQKHAARPVFRKQRSDHVTPLRKKLHWLPAAERIFFKLATLSFRYFDDTLPPYLYRHFSSYTPSRSLLSSSQKRLTVARVDLKSVLARSFQCQAPAAWSSLPLNIRLFSSLLSFEAQLETHPFRLTVILTNHLCVRLGWKLTVCCRQRMKDR